MHIIQFWRILWARRKFIIATTLSCLLGGFVLIQLLPPRYESHARVMLGLLKPDPVTGLMMSGGSAGAYVATQMELITDYNVTGKVADAVGWSTDPGLLSQYQHRSKKDQRDYQHWIAQRVADNTTAKLLDGSNILEITYKANSSQDARAVAEAVQQAYLDTSLAMRRDDATRQADWFEGQANKALGLLTAAEDAKVAYEKANGVMMQDDKQDIDSARLQIMSQQGVPTATSVAPTLQSSPSAVELAQTDVAIAQQSKVLGPNHPDLLALKGRRAALAALVAKDEQAQKATVGAIAAAASANARALNAAIDVQKSNIIAKSDKLEHLKQLQTEVNLRREQFDKATAAAADFRQQAAVANTGLSILGHATTPAAPTFPNPVLILPGSFALGFLFGVLLSLLIEFLARRVRGPEDLEGLDGMSVLAIVPTLQGRVRGGGAKGERRPRGLRTRGAMASA